MSEPLTVVIPTLDEAAHLPACLQGLRDHLTPADELIVVDGGSRDGTPGCLAALNGQPHRLLTCEPGRGRQIAAGVAAAETDVIVVLHADVRLCDEALGVIRDHFAADPALAFACLRHRFRDGDGPLARLSEWINDAKVRLGGLAFGDQVQVFRRSALDPQGGFPELPLMEDVELCFRLGRRCKLLPAHALASTRCWTRGPRWRHWVRIYSWVTLFIACRLVGRHVRLTDWMYRRYYRKA